MGVNLFCVRSIFMALLAVIAFSTEAQSVFKCTVDGVTTFSQTPCDDQYETIDVDVSSGTPEHQNSSARIEQLCLDVVLAKIGNIHPKSARVTKSETQWLTDKSGARQVMTLYIYDEGEAQQYYHEQESRANTVAEVETNNTRAVNHENSTKSLSYSPVANRKNNNAEPLENEKRYSAKPYQCFLNHDGTAPSKIQYLVL
ncbi:hypothetical protein GCM10009111_28350 [Colwellia asteriadis]|uniref:DUF4124 domain-containing protein n=1 Tax=Colwellia asteriadis TaxID=517723 RepID=A0ABP3WL11_9GAMM